MSEYGYLVGRRGVPIGQAYAEGDVVDIYPLEEPLDVSRVGTKEAKHDATFDPHAAAHLEGPLLRREQAHLRRVKVLVCSCKSSRSLAVAYLFRGRVWVVVGQERVPAAFRNRTRYTTPSAWPLHTEPSGAPHIEMTTCGDCRKVWAIALTTTGLSRIDLARPLYSRRVTA